MFSQWHHNNIYETAEIGEGTKIGSYVEIGDKVKIGKNCKIQSKVFIPAGITIGDNVFIGPGVIFCNDSHPKADNEHFVPETTSVGNGVSIGAGSIIMPGIIILDEAVIGAGSLVINNCSAHRTYFGHPAKLYCPAGFEYCMGCGQCDK